jgi:hypothetical protein
MCEERGRALAKLRPLHRVSADAEEAKRSRSGSRAARIAQGYRITARAAQKLYPVEVYALILQGGGEAILVGLQ